MATSFLLRFQESVQPIAADVSCGTRTVTETSREAGDQDPSISNMVTMTVTAVQAEQTDTDPGDGPSGFVYRAIPISHRMGTHTMTKTREEPDQDPTMQSAGTQTSTRTREEPDQDLANIGYTALPVAQI